MSCQPGSPCYNSTTNTSGDPCNPNNSVSCETVVYNGPALPTIGIDTCTNLCVALQEIDNVISTIIDNTANLITASNGLTKVSNDIRLGGNLTQTTLINTGVFDLILGGIDTGSSSDDILVITSGGIVRRVSQTSLAPTIGITPNTGLKWTDPAETQLQTIYNTLIADAAVSVPVGGAVSHPASYWKTKTFVEVFDEILFPEQLPTYTIPTVQITGITGGLREVGTALGINATIRADRWDGGAFASVVLTKTVNGSGTPISLSLSGPTTGAVFGENFPTITDPNSPNQYWTATHVDSNNVPAPSSGASSTVTYVAVGSHAAGIKKYTSRNNQDTRSAVCPSVTTDPIDICTASSATYTITGIYPIFYGVIDNPSGSATVTNASIAADIQSNGSSGRTSTKLPLTLASGTITIPFPANLNQKTFWIAVPTSGNANKTKFKPLWYPIENSFGPTAAWDIYGTVNVTSPTSLWNGISYTIYRSNYPTGTGTPGDFQIY